MPAATPKRSFDAQYQLLRQHLTLKGLQSKTIDAYSRAISRIGHYFDHDIDALRSDQLASYFSQPLQIHSWTTVKLDLYSLKFYHQHMLQKPWIAASLLALNTALNRRNLRKNARELSQYGTRPV
jgi:integrase/recombinase XerD